MNAFAPAIQGFFYSVITFMVFSMNDAVMKFLQDKHSPAQAVFFSYLGVVVLLLAQWLFLAKEKQRELFNFKNKKLHILRSIIHAGAIVGLMRSFGVMPMSDTYVIIFTMPLLIALFSQTVLKEKVGLPLYLCLAASFGGILLAFPPSGALNGDVLICFGAVLLYATSVLIMRRLSADESSKSIMFSMNALVALWLCPLVFISFTPLDGRDVALLFFTSLTNLFGYGLFIKACRLAPASLVTIPQFLQLVYGALLGYFLFGDVPTWGVVAGGSIVIAANLLLIFYQNKKAKPA